MVGLRTGGKAWLAWEKIKPPIASGEEDIKQALMGTIRVRVTGQDATTGIALVTMWTAEDEANWEETYARERERSRREQEQKSQQEKLRLRQHYNPNEWLKGTVVAVKDFGIFVKIFADLDVLVPTNSIPEELTVAGGEAEGGRIPDFKPREPVEIRIVGFQGTDDRGRDKYRCSMMPIDSPVAGGDAAAGVSRGLGGRGAPGGLGKPSSEGFSVWSEGRALETESTLAKQEGQYMNTLKAEELKKEFGATDRRAYLAAKGFTVVDYATQLQLQEACKPDPSKRKIDPKAKAEVRPLSSGKTIPVWICFGSKSKPIGSIITYPNMIDAEKERLALTVASREANDAVQNGASISKVDVTEKAIFVRVRTPGGQKF